MDDLDVQVVYERKDYNHQGMFEEQIGLRVGEQVRWYGYRSSFGGERTEQRLRWQSIGRLLREIVRRCEAGNVEEKSR